jgi:uncharacterized protein YaiE (UPF0345 family)
LSGKEAWIAVKGGESFEIPAQSKFLLGIRQITDYSCSFIK